MITPMIGMTDYLPRLFAQLQVGWEDGHRYLMLAHLFDDTLRMIEAMEPKVQFDAIIGIPYSSNRPGLRETWQGRFGTRAHLPLSMPALEACLIEQLDRSLTLCASTGERLIVQEVGGFVVPLLHRHFADRLGLVKGVVELTKQGVWRSSETKTAFPVLHCADSELKRLEAKRCGETIVRCLDGLFRQQGLALAGRMATVFGAGWIGRGVADGLRSLDAVPALVDPDPLKVTEARLDGFQASVRDVWSHRSHLCVGATGQTSITAKTLMQLPHNAVVASGSSRQMEIDVGFLKTLPSQEISEAVTGYRLPGSGKLIQLVNQGFPANFMPGSASVPDEVVEPILGELMVLMRDLTRSDIAPGIHRISKSQERVCADLWLGMRDENIAQPLIAAAG